MKDEGFRRIDTLIQVGLRLARTAGSGRIGLARAADAIELAWIPRPWGDEIAAQLASAQAATRDPLPAKRVHGILRDAWGSIEVDDLELEPVAVTPTSQVQRATLDGAAVAVKILRPGIRSAVRQDFALLEALVAPLSAAFPALDANGVLGEFRERVLEELDLEHEATVQRRFHRALRGHPHIRIPEPFTRLAHENVLVSEWVEGVPLSEAPDGDDAAAKLVLFVLGAARGGFIHADPNPDDVLVQSDRRLAILDFGATRTVDPERVATAQQVLEAFLDEDPQALGEALDQLGWLPASHAEPAAKLAAEVLDELAQPGPSRLDTPAVLAARDRLIERADRLNGMIAAGALPPQDLWPARAVGQLFGTIARIGATGAWVSLARSALREGWEARV